MTEPPEIEITGGYLDATILANGQPFPYPIRNITWNLGPNEDSVPSLTITIDCKRIRIDHTWPPKTP